MATLATRVPGLVASRRYDLTFFQRELLSTFCTLEPLAKGPRVIDLDDAVWLGHEHSIARLLRHMDGAVCGNQFIADWASGTTPHVAVVPTAVDACRFVPAPDLRAAQAARHPVIGWSGLHAGSHYLLAIEGAIARALEAVPGATLRVVSDRRPALSRIPPERVEYVRWSPAVEVSTLQDLTVGIMPLDDTPWERGKCSYKMLLYMACGIPVVVSPVGMNVEVLARGAVGHAARSEAQWVDALVALLRDPERGQALGDDGRRVVAEHYSVDVLTPRLAAFLRVRAAAA